MKRLTIIIAAALAAVANAQYSIDWWTIDGGGGTSTGGVYSVSGTIGQPDAGTMSGGSFAVQGGFWNVVAVQTPGAPLLSITRTNANILIYWPAAGADGFLLQQTSNLTTNGATWSFVANPYATNAGVISVTVPAAEAMRYYRLRKP